MCNFFLVISYGICTSFADRRGRHNRQVESHIYHEEPRIDLIERNGSVSSTRSIGSLKHQSSGVSIGSEGRFEFLRATPDHSTIVKGSVCCSVFFRSCYSSMMQMACNHSCQIDCF